MARTVLSEAEKLRRVPGIYFADEPAGRVAKVAGTGLGVWEIIDTHPERPLTLAGLAAYYDWLTPEQLQAALAYYAAFPEEIDAEIAENDAITPETLYARYPFMRPA